ncbi:MAG TPA: hypothetical protein VFQ45_07430 [Longimicrobium sp.]|nr:hypothetical protein [Longimicrobium sp.]
MTEIVVLVLASTAAWVALVSSSRAIRRQHAQAIGPLAPSSTKTSVLIAKQAAVYDGIESELRGAPHIDIRGVRIVDRAELVTVAVSLLSDRLDSADEEEVQKLLPRLQYLEQKGLERLAEIHLQVTPDCDSRV